MGSTVIVALPAVGEQVYDVSSEKVPHLTMLYLGDLVEDMDIPDIVTFVQHAARHLEPFYLTVDHRGVLGDKQADVLFFEDEFWEMPNLKRFRHQLLLNEAIKRGYDSWEQFPEWRPHLTLGYPETPAKSDDMVHGVHFDRLAVWFDDYEGVDIRLNRDYRSLEVAMSDMESGKLATEQVLAHYGVKGMKWGVRKVEKNRAIAERSQRVADGTASRKDKVDQVFGKGAPLTTGGVLMLHPTYANKLAAKYNKKADTAQAKVDAKARKAEAIAAHKKWKEEAGGTEMANKVFQKAAKDFEKTAEIINNDPNYKDQDVTRGIKAKQYQATMNHYFNEHMAQASVDLTLNDQGRAYIYQFDSRSGMMKGTEHKIASIETMTDDQAIGQLIDDGLLEHAEASKFEMPDYNVVLDEQGHMLEFSLAGELFHYGVKGMKWGVRRTDAQLARAAEGPTPVTVTQKKPGKYAKAKGGQGNPMDPDAQTALEIRQKAKKSTTDAVSNKDLRAAIERMQLEQRYRELEFNSDRRSKGARFAAGLLGKKRYTGEKRRYEDFNEKMGEESRKAGGAASARVKDALAVGAAIKKTNLNNIY